jgi:transposase
MFRQGRTQAEVAKKFGVSRAAACKWYAAWDAEGIRGLDSKGPPGFASALDHKNRRQFKKAILKGPLSHGYGTDLWTLSRLVAVLKKTTKVSFGPVRTWQIVRELGFTPQKPQLRARERDEKAIEDWKTRRLPGLKKMGSRTWVLARI